VRRLEANSYERLAGPDPPGTPLACPHRTRRHARRGAPPFGGRGYTSWNRTYRRGWAKRLGSNERYWQRGCPGEQSDPRPGPCNFGGRLRFRLFGLR